MKLTKAMQQIKEIHRNQNKAEYGENYDLFKWIDEDGIALAEQRRKELLAEIGQDVSWDYNKTKVDCSSLSPGCRSCGTGTWSCLFINNMCNATCFFCPSLQNDLAEPTTSSISFPEPSDYIEYIKKFNIKGVSISGGEPLITFDKSLRFVKEVRKALGQEVYIWLYTNGLLLDSEKADKLSEAGLDEIRFDLSAVGYKTAKIKHVVGKIKNITVEIPAIPEDLELLKSLLPKLKEEGVNFLHLHQLRCTPFNQENLRNKTYTFLHGPKVSVLESELTALELIAWEKKNNIGLPINYCSFVYKNKFQAISARKRYAPFIKNPFEDVTEAGYIRSLYTKGTRSEIAELTKLFMQNGVDCDLYQVANMGESLFFSLDLYEMVREKLNTIFVTYFNPIIRPSVSYYNVFKEIMLTDKKKVVLEKVKGLTKALDTADSKLIDGIRNGSLNLAEYNGESECYAFEWFHEGLQSYY
jgi:uncharacterized protein